MRNLCASSTPDSFVCQFVVNFFFVFPRLLSALSFLLNVPRLSGNPWYCLIANLFENPLFHLLLETRLSTASRRVFRFVIKKHSGLSIIAIDSRRRSLLSANERGSVVSLVSLRFFLASPWGHEVIRGSAERAETAKQESCQDSTTRRRSRRGSAAHAVALFIRIRGKNNPWLLCLSLERDTPLVWRV